MNAENERLRFDGTMIILIAGLAAGRLISPTAVRKVLEAWMEFESKMEEKRQAWLSARRQLISRRRLEMGWVRRAWLNYRNPIPPEFMFPCELPKL